MGSINFFMENGLIELDFESGALTVNYDRYHDIVTDMLQQVLLIQYPRKGVWSLAFQTSTDLGEVQHRTGEQLICTFVPTTPNPTSGFIIMVPRNEAVVLDMPVEDALKMIISLGVVVPDWAPGKPLPAVAAAPDST